MNRRLYLRVAVLALAACFSTASLIADDPKLAEALATIRKSESVNESGVGFGLSRTPVYDAYETVSKLADKDLLLQYTQDPNVNLRAYAAKALRQKFPKDDFFDLLMAKLKDETRFVYFSGCLQSPQTIGDFYFTLLGKKLTKAQRARVLDYLLTQPNRLALTRVALQSWDIPESYLPAIRAKVRQGDGAALIALANFKREQDLATLAAAAKQHPFEVYRAIALNPHPAFFPLLEKAHPALLREKYWSTTQREFYTAVAAYKDAPAAALMTRVLDGNAKAIPMRDYHLKFVYQAILQSPVEIYDPLTWRFWADFDRVDLPIFERLLKLDRPRANQLARATLERLDREWSFKFLTAMLAEIARTEPELVTKAVARQLAKCQISNYEFYARIAHQTPQDFFIEPLLVAVDTADNPHIFLAASKVLLSYRREPIDQRLATAPTRNSALTTGWGGDAFRSLMTDRPRTGQFENELSDRAEF